MNKKKYIGIDIGGTAVKIGSVDEDGTIHATETYAVNFDGYETPILQTVVKSCHNFLEKYRENAFEYVSRSNPSFAYLIANLLLPSS